MFFCENKLIHVKLLFRYFEITVFQKDHLFLSIEASIVSVILF